MFQTTNQPITSPFMVASIPTIVYTDIRYIPLCIPLVNGKDYPIYYGKYKSCSKPPTKLSMSKFDFTGRNARLNQQRSLRGGETTPYNKQYESQWGSFKKENEPPTTRIPGFSLSLCLSIPKLMGSASDSTSPYPAKHFFEGIPKVQTPPD